MSNRNTVPCLLHEAVLLLELYSWNQPGVDDLLARIEKALPDDIELACNEDKNTLIDSKQ